jgi:ABC-type Mn2+/Zn2+ transport system ATPase subunit
MTQNIEVKDLQVSYYGKTAIKDINFSFEGGKLIGILGPNGAGKYTALKAIIGLIPRDKGTVQLSGQAVDEIRKEIAYVPQRSNIDWDFPIEVKEAVLLGTFPRLGLFHRPGKKERELAKECLEKVGMLEFANHQIGELSGGQQQRVFMARALAQKAEYFFLDEPFVGIDVSSEEIIMDILKELRSEGKIVLIVHHDLSKVSSYFDDVILLNKKMVASGPVSEVFTTDNLSIAYERPIDANFSLEAMV